MRNLSMKVEIYTNSLTEVGFEVRSSVKVEDYNTGKASHLLQVCAKLECKIKELVEEANKNLIKEDTARRIENLKSGIRELEEL